MTDYLLDTNHASWLLEQRETIIARLRQARTVDSTFGISVTVLGELYYAVYASQRATENLHRLQALVGTFTLWAFDALAAQEFGRIQAEQKAKGRPIPPMDAQIAAVARLNNLTLLTDDHHFAFIDGITVENWHA
ncbi:MAG: type II toxin-antitoxin system VapC family toxin [Anaerolineales bacterium]